MKLLAIVSTGLSRFVRDRFNLFFVFLFPLAIVLLIGIQYGEAPTLQVGVVGPGGELSEEIVDRLDATDRVEVVLHTDPDVVSDEVESGDLDAGLVLPDDLEDAAWEGRATEVTFVSSPFGVGPQLRTVVDDALARTLAVPTAVGAATDRGADPAAARDAAAEATWVLDVVEVQTSTTGERLFPEDVTGYDVGAASQLVLFMFLTSLTGAAALIQTRKLGVATRMLSTPTSLGTIIGGEAITRFCIAAGQGVYIMVATVVLFGVDWGDLVAAGAVLVAFAAVGAAAAMLSGSVFSNDEQAAGIGVIVGLGLAALGGAMLPVELFTDAMLTIARFIPHYWAIDALADVVRRDAGLVDIVPQLGILLAFAASIGVIAVWRLRVALTR